MDLPSRLTVFNYQYFLDGGTTSLRTRDEHGQTHDVLLVQHAFPGPGSSLKAIPGRLYFDGRLVSMRSDDEAAVLRLLKTAEIGYSDFPPGPGGAFAFPPGVLLLGGLREMAARGPEENLRILLTDVIRFVESDEYLRFAERVEMAVDPTRYTVWPAYDAATRKRAIVRLGRVLGIGLPAAAETLDRGTPLAEDVSATEVSDLAGRYVPEGLELRVEPEFRWSLG